MEQTTELGMSFWWEEAEEKAHEAIFSTVRWIKQNQASIEEADVRHLKLYGNQNIMGLSNYSSFNPGNSTINERQGINVVQSCIDTLTHKICKDKPRPTFLTDGGSWDKQQKAQLFTKFVDGQFYGLKMHELSPMSFRDSCILGSGFIKIWKEGNKIKAEKTFTPELVVDENEGAFGQPRSLYQIKVIPKEYLAKLWPKYESKIKQTPGAKTAFPGHRQLSQQVMVIEAWHLPANKESKDGRHVICVQNCTFVDEVYEKDYFPFVKIDYMPRPMGWRGQGLAEILTPVQYRINKILFDMNRAQDLAVPKYMLEMGSKVIKSHVNNEIGGLLWYSGTPPVYNTPAPFSDQWFVLLNWFYMKAFELAGISQLAAQAKKPDGLNSGKALREFSDLESERYILTQQAWETFHMDAAKIIIDLAKEIAAEEGDYAVMAKDHDQLIKIKWSDISLEDDQYVMQLFPTSFLSKTPAGKLQDVVELAQAGFVDKANALRLLDFPDLKAYTKRANAPLDDIDKQIELIKYKGQFVGPEPFQNLQQAIGIFQSAYLQSKVEGVPESRLEMLRQWIEMAKAMLDQSAQVMAMQSQAMAPAMPARPEQAPANPMLPPGGM